MIIVHNTFVCKPGNAGKLAKLFKEWAANKPGIIILTDMTGQFHRVIMSSTHESLSAYEADTKKEMEDEAKNKEMMEKFKDMNDMYVSGSREIFKVW